VRVHLEGVCSSHGATVILRDVSLSLPARARVGLVGPNGVGKTTLLRLVAGQAVPDSGRVVREPSTLEVGYLPQEPGPLPGETVMGLLGRRTGVAASERELERAAASLADGRPAEAAYDRALTRFLTLGGGDLEQRADAVARDIGLRVALDRPVAELSGGEAARASLASILLARFDVLALDEPTNDLDFAGLDVLERHLAGFAGGLIVVSHDRAFLDRTVDRVVALDPVTREAREYAGGWTAYAARREAEQAAAWARYADADERRRHLAGLLAERRAQARAGGAMTDRRGTKALAGKVRQAERHLGRADDAAKPVVPWQLRLSLAHAGGGGDVVAELAGAVADLGTVRIGPVSLALTAGERVAVTGANGTGKTTLLRMLLGEQPLVAGTRRVGPGTRIGAIGQGRSAYDGPIGLLDAFAARSGLHGEPARTLLAKFGLGADAIGRPCESLSPGERTRAHLAELQGREANLLILDEPTNHLDLEAVEQLELALTDYPGTLVVVSHDRRFLETLGPDRELSLA
jgi:ATPase subunit of ABC transporter with duplicated ATPase domains